MKKVIGMIEDEGSKAQPSYEVASKLKPSMDLSALKDLSYKGLSEVTVMRYNDQGGLISSRKYELSYEKDQTTIMMTMPDGSWSRGEYAFRPNGKLFSVGINPYITETDGTRYYLKDLNGLSQEQVKQVQYYQVLSFLPLYSDSVMQVTETRDGKAYRKFESSPLDFAMPEETSGPKSIPGNKELFSYRGQYASAYGIGDGEKLFRRRVVQSNWDENEGWVEQPVKLDIFSGGADLISSRPFLYVRVDLSRDDWTSNALSSLVLSSAPSTQGSDAYPPLMYVTNAYGYHQMGCGAGKVFWVGEGYISYNFSKNQQCDPQKNEMCGTIIDVTDNFCSWDKKTGLITSVQEQDVRLVQLETERDASGHLTSEKLVDSDTGVVVEQHDFKYDNFSHKEKLPPPVLSIPGLGYETSVFLRDRMRDALEPNGLGLIMMDGFQSSLTHIVGE
jgi:hypothetical protein